MTASKAFHLLDERIQRFLWLEQWEELREVQEHAIPLVLPADRDVLIAAATAAGKTEAAFLPALTRLLAEDSLGLIVYISPLKALINDQFGRLDRLCEHLDVPVWPWHGDVSASLKSRFLRNPSGVLLITPESLEATFCNRGMATSTLFSRTRYLVVDELHAFIGSERGKQLQSLMHRIETAIGRTVPRIGLSATLGDMSLAATYLRADGQAARVETDAEGTTLLIKVRGFVEPAPSIPVDDDHEVEPQAPKAIAQHLFQSLRGSNNLVFPNSRREVERYTHHLQELSAEAQVPNEFWPHHGNLSREIRSETEAALKQKERPASAICTSTLELGIDIGAVKSVAQIGPPPSVASLRQRLGRSGRRPGEPAILRGYVVEEGIEAGSSLASRLRLDTVQTAACISLLLENWFEPPASRGMHLSTLVQQLMSSIAQYGGLQAGQAFALLCGKGGAFEGLGKSEFASLLRYLAEKDFLIQDSSGLLLHGGLGDKIVNHYTFYAAFTADEEFRVVAGGKTLGSLPVVQMLVAGQRIVFAGRTWLVESIDEPTKSIHVVPAKGGAPPMFNGTGGRVHTRVRERMRELYEGVCNPPYLDEQALAFLREGRDEYERLELSHRQLIDEGSEVLITTWMGDAVNEALACLLTSKGITASIARLGVEVRTGGRSIEDIEDSLADLSIDGIPPVEVLLADVENLQRQKWDWALPPELLRQSYASLSLNIEGARGWLAKFRDSLERKAEQRLG